MRSRPRGWVRGDASRRGAETLVVGSLGGRRENEHTLLARLRGPAGQRVYYKRLGSGCEFPSPMGSSAMIRTRGLTHIHLVVRDLERSLRFYQSVFGMEERFRDGSEMVFLNTPG